MTLEQDIRRLVMRLNPFERVSKSELTVTVNSNPRTVGRILDKLVDEQILTKYEDTSQYGRSWFTLFEVADFIDSFKDSSPTVKISEDKVLLQFWKNEKSIDFVMTENEAESLSSKLSSHVIDKIGGSIARSSHQASIDRF